MEFPPPREDSLGSSVKKMGARQFQGLNYTQDPYNSDFSDSDQIEPPKQAATISAISTHLTSVSPLLTGGKKNGPNSCTSN